MTELPPSCSGTTPFANHSPSPLIIRPIAKPEDGIAGLSISGALEEVGWNALAEVCAKLEGTTHLLDFSGVISCHSSLEDAATFGFRLIRGAGTSRPSYLMVARGDLMFGMCRRVQIALDDACMRVNVFRTLSMALLWLKQNPQVDSKA